MKHHTLAAMVASALALGSASAHAADGVLRLNERFDRIIVAAADDHAAQGDAWKRWADEFSREMRSSVGTLFANRVDARKVVKGAPYSAEVVTETNQQLPDGNVISRKTSGRVFRDAEGRTRQETGIEGKSATVHIYDPVEGKRFVTSEGKRTVEMSTPKASELAERERERAERARERAEAAADRAKDRAERDAERARQRAERAKEGGSVSRSSQVVRVGGTEVRIEDGKVFVDGKEVPGGRVEQKNASGKTVIVENGRIFIDGKELNTPTAPRAPGVVMHRHVDGDGKEIHVKTIRTGDGREIAIAPPPPVPPSPPTPGVAAPVAPMPPMPPMAGLQTMRFDTARLGKGVTTHLGMRDFDGVKAEGKSTVWTIPAGEIGNRNAINITSETWYSPDLQVTVMSRYNDPRTGESVYRLAGIQRSEPAPDLFKAPEKASKR
jgi:hypothetical protein